MFFFPNHCYISITQIANDFPNSSLPFVYQIVMPFVTAQESAITKYYVKIYMNVIVASKFTTQQAIPEVMKLNGSQINLRYLRHIFIESIKRSFQGKSANTRYLVSVKSTCSSQRRRGACMPGCSSNSSASLISYSGFCLCFLITGH